MIQYDPIKPTDWVTPLEKIYDRQSTQLDRYHDQLRERDRQEQEAQIDWVETISKLAEFSSTIHKGMEARKAKTQKKDWSEVKNVLNSAKSLEEVRTISEDYQLKKKGLLENWDKYEERIKKSKVLSTEQKSFLLDDSPKRQLRIKEVLGQSEITAIDSSWQAASKTGKWQEKITELGGTPTAINEVRREFVDERLNSYKYKDGFLLENITKERDRFLSTKNTVTEIKDKNIKFSNAEALFETTGDQFHLTGTNEQIGDHHQSYITKHGALSSDPNSDDTEIQQGVQKWKATQTRILKKGEDSLGDLQKILNSEVKHKGFITKDNPEGKTTFRKAFLTDEDVAELTQSANIGVKIKWDTTKANKELEQITFLQKVQSGQATKEEWLSEIEVLERSPHANKDLIKELKELDPDAQNAAVEADLTKEWDTHIDNGFYGKTEEDIKTIPNYKVRQKAKKKWDQLKKAEAAHPSQKGDMDSTVHSARTEIPWANKLTDPTGKQIALELDKAGEAYRASLVYAQYTTGKYIPDPEIGTKTLLFKQGLWKSRGGGTVGGDGRYSVDKMGGSFKNFQTASRMRIRANDSHNVKYTVENGDAWAAGVQANMSSFKTKEGDFDYEGFIESGLAYSQQDLVGTLTNNSYSEKMQYIADYLNTDVETLFESSLKEAKKDKDFARRWDLDKLEKPIDTQIRDDLDRAFERYDGDSMQTYRLKDLKYVMRKGWKNLSNKQKTRVYNFLKTNSSLSEEASADADLARQEKDKAVADALSLERLQVEQKRRKEKEDKEKQRNEQAEQLQEQIEGLWTP